MRVPHPDLAALRDRARAFLPELPDVLGIAGVACVVRGTALWSVPAAWVVAGTFGVAAALGLAYIHHNHRRGLR